MEFRRVLFRSGIDERLHDGVEVAVEHLVEVVGLEVDPVVADAVLREVVSEYAFAAVDGAHLTASCIARRGVRLLLSLGEQPGTQNAHRRLLVLQLALLVLAGDDDAGWLMGDADRGVGGVDALATWTARAVDVDAEVVGVDLDLDL